MLVRGLEPIGTITKDYPFLEEKSLTILRTVLKKASDYADFTKQLTEAISEPGSPQDLVFVAYFHALNLDLPNKIAQIEEVHRENLAIRSYSISTEGEGLDTLIEAVEEIIRTKPSDLVAFSLYMRILRSSALGSKEEANAQKKIEKLIKKNKKLQPHSVYYYGHMGRRSRFEGNPEEALKLFRRALQLSIEHDEKWYQSRMLHLIAEILGTFSSSRESYEEAKEYLLEAQGIVRSLGDRDGEAMILTNVAVISAGRREMEEAIKAQIEALRIKESIGHNTSVGAYNLSRHFADLCQGREALEWAKLALERWGHLRSSAPYAHLAMANALIQLGRLEEAKEHLDRSRELVFGAGLEMALGDWYGTNGLLERRMGDPESAMYSFEQAYEVHERTRRQSRLRRGLLNLTETELMLFSPTKENRDDETSGPWMSRFRDVVDELQIPGLTAEYLLLEAELRTMQSRTKEAEEIMAMVLEITDNTALRPIHEIALKVRQAWILDGVLPASATSKTRRSE